MSGVGRRALKPASIAQYPGQKSHHHVHVHPSVADQPVFNLVGLHIILIIPPLRRSTFFGLGLFQPMSHRAGPV